MYIIRSYLEEGNQKLKGVTNMTIQTTVLKLINEGKAIKIGEVTISRKKHARKYDVVDGMYVSKWSKIKVAKAIQEEISAHSFDELYREETGG